MQYPLELSFKKRTLVPQIHMTDASGTSIFYVKQKLYAQIDDVTVYADDTQTKKLYIINADRTNHFSDKYYFTDQGGIAFGSVKRQEREKLWRAHYQVCDGDAPIMTIRESNPFIKMVDTAFEFIPILNLFPGYIVRPTYNLISDCDGSIVMKMKKKPNFNERKFIIERVKRIGDQEQTEALLSLLMMVLLGKVRWGILIS